MTTVRTLALRDDPALRAAERALAGPGGDEPRRRELGDFLRSRRARIAPEQVGVASFGRRRTPGLRREEVAQLSGVGVTWYTWLEQGRDIRASEQVLNAIARTLMLSGAERGHLFTLAGLGDVDIVAACHAVTDAHRAVLSQLDPFPASICSGKYDLLAYNDGYNALFGDLDSLPLEERNVLWLMFTDPRWRERYVNWSAATAQMVANLRGLMAEHVGDATWKTFVARLNAVSPEFAELWARHDVHEIENKTKQVRHPDHGVLSFDTANTWLGPRPGRRMLVYVPADEHAAAAMRTLVGA